MGPTLLTSTGMLHTMGMTEISNFERPAGSSSRIRTTVGKLLLCAVVFEGTLMGSGRMAMIGPLTLKMWLFILMLIYTTWSLIFFERIRLSTAILTCAFAALLFLAGMTGVAHSANLKFLGEDVSPLLSFFAFPFFELTVRTREDIHFVIRTILVAAVVMACCYAVIVVSLWLSLWLGISSLGNLLRMDRAFRRQ